MIIGPRTPFNSSSERSGVDEGSVVPKKPEMDKCVFDEIFDIDGFHSSPLLTLTLLYL